MDPASLVLEREIIFQRMGYPPTAMKRAPASVAELVDAAREEARGLIEPRAVWTTVDVHFGQPAGELHCTDRSLATGGIIASQLQKSRQVVAFVATIGSKLESEAERRFRTGDPPMGYVLSAIGSEAVETWTDVVAERIAAFAHVGGWRSTNRFSPGYCLWDTAEQRVLFELLPPRPAGVSLNDHALMVPLKSVSGIIGLGPDVERRPYPCDRCGVEDCTHRLIAARRG